jgi:hypothetical protein
VFFRQFLDKWNPFIDEILVPAQEGDENKIEVPGKIIWECHFLAQQVAAFDGW